jgi:hypothetical protein
MSKYFDPIIIGGNYIDLEVTASTRRFDTIATLLKITLYLLTLVINLEVNSFYNNVHCKERGYVRTSVTVTSFKATQNAPCIITNFGHFYANCVLVGVETVKNAINQAAFATIYAAGHLVHSDPLPWFWLDQYDLNSKPPELTQVLSELLSEAITTNVLSVFVTRKTTGLLQ